MFDRIPIQVWLLLLIGIIGYAQWKAQRPPILKAAVAVGIVGIAFFIFTDAARELALSKIFWPALLVTVGAWALTTVPEGLRDGKIEPFVQGIHTSFERGNQPKRFWASMAWNAILGSVCIWLAHDMYVEGPRRELEERCRGWDQNSTPKEELSACTDLIGDNGADGDMIANAHLHRGLIFLNSGKFDAAIIDFTRLHELRPNDAVSLANRGISYAWKKDSDRAKTDFEVVRRIDPSNPVMLRGEALLSMFANNPKSALEYLSAALAQNPEDRWSLSMRSQVYVWLGDDQKAAADAEKLRSLIEADKKERPDRD